MPELSRFFGIIIRMYSEPGAPHQKAHFHAYYGAETAVHGLEPIELLSGELSRPQARLVEAWAELHIAELRDNWIKLQSGRAASPIRPLT